MPFYRVYEVGEHGSFVSGSDVEFDDDEHALATVRKGLVLGATMEIWDKTRCVGRVSEPL